ncbi:hypothetical protein EF294_06225 [Gordonia oryzae]|uniref:DUF3566 domain-containing protein n=1 Tax=Gordonia oryzae TaxID=2487349 RepID=A0A3N4H1N7_9ACTN|nr:DUF3566 domain-containing protein [Gordonia oryzae]RPA64720.1 hypothetical protein EF294_06225 [Gordonia oryzae]
MTPVSQPNDPDNQTSSTPPTASGGPAAQSGPPRGGGLVPPWQRGPGAVAGPETTASAQVPVPDAGTTEQIPVGGRPGGPPPRGVVTGGDTPVAGTSGQQAPVTKLDSPTGASTATAEAPRGRFTETPTRTIARDPSVEAELPDLDQIHHTNTEAARAAAVDPAKVTGSAERSAPAHVGSTGRGLRAAVQIRRLDPWATFKVVGVLSIVGFVIWMIAVAVLYLVLDGMGVWEQVNSSFGTSVTTGGSTSQNDIIGAGSVFFYAALLGAVNAVLITALGTIGSYIYNLVADLVGGLEITLADLD